MTAQERLCGNATCQHPQSEHDHGIVTNFETGWATWCRGVGTKVPQCGCLHFVPPAEPEPLAATEDFCLLCNGEGWIAQPTGDDGEREPQQVPCPYGGDEARHHAFFVGNLHAACRAQFESIAARIEAATDTINREYTDLSYGSGTSKRIVGAAVYDLRAIVNEIRRSGKS